MNDIIKVENAIIKNMTVTVDLCDRFCHFIDASQNTVETYRRDIRQLLSYLSSKGINKPQRDDIISFRDELKATGHKPSTVQNYITAARLFFTWLEQEGLYPNIAEHIKGAKLDKEHKKDYLTSGQVKVVLNTVDRSTEKGLRDYAILALCVTGGLRTIEVARANIEDIRTVGDNTVLFLQGKGREERAEYVKLSAPVEAAIRAYLKERGETDGSAPLFASTSNNNNGQRMTTRAISGILKGSMQEAGYNSDRLTAHSFRHTAVTLALLQGESLEEVQQFARHRNIQTTLIYSHALEKAKNHCSEAVSNAIF